MKQSWIKWMYDSKFKVTEGKFQGEFLEGYRCMPDVINNQPNYFVEKNI